MKRLKCPHCDHLTDLLIPIRGDYKCHECKQWFRIRDGLRQAVGRYVK